MTVFISKKKKGNDCVCDETENVCVKFDTNLT